MKEKESELYSISLKDAIKSGVSQYGNINLEIFDGDFNVMADDLLPEIFVNIVGNSLKYGGKDVQISINAEVTGNFVYVWVSDDGPGISDETKPEVFGRFKRGKGEMEQGSGLGLYIVKMLADRYGGDIKIEDSYPEREKSGVSVCFSLKKG